jgi:thiol-disulfide isomerase/thioredoxin
MGGPDAERERATRCNRINIARGIIEMTKRRMFTPTLQVLALVFLLPLAFSSYGQIERYVAGTHYTELSVPVNTNDSSKIEVIEAFWYGCTHCFSFEPLINDWASKLPDDVDFKLFPAMWNGLKAEAVSTAIPECFDYLNLRGIIGIYRNT